MRVLREMPARACEHCGKWKRGGCMRHRCASCNNMAAYGSRTCGPCHNYMTRIAELANIDSETCWRVVEEARRVAPCAPEAPATKAALRRVEQIVSEE